MKAKGENDKYNNIEYSADDNKGTTASQTERCIVRDCANERIDDDANQCAPDDDQGQVNTFVGRIQKLHDHTRNDDGEQRLPVKLIGEPEHIQIDLIAQGERPRGIASSLTDTIWFIGNLHDRTFPSALSP